LTDPFGTGDNARNLILADKIELAYAWVAEKPGRLAEVEGPELMGGRQTCCPYLVDWVMKMFAIQEPTPEQEAAGWVDPWAEIGVTVF
jgi:hypothetical protein